MSLKTTYSTLKSFTTRDNSQIRELMHPEAHARTLGVVAQSLAEARVSCGSKTHLHCHHKSEELYHITAGNGIMTLGDESFPIHVGDTICIQPGTPHCVENNGDEELVILCCCSPAYSNSDTELL